jgi:hypothetical protein
MFVSIFKLGRVFADDTVAIDEINDYLNSANFAYWASHG